MRTCWAAVLGKCGGGISGEHVISKGLFRGKAVQVQGTPWKAEKLKPIGINTLTANILCRDHNSALSKVDDEGMAAFHAIRRFEEVLSGRMTPINATDLQHHVSGHMLERWFIKHAVNLFIVTGRQRQWYDGSEAITPPRDIVEAAFGMHQLRYPRGLYNWAGLKIGEQKVVGDQVAFVPIYNLVNKYVGASFEFQALSFLIWLDDKHPDSNGVPWPSIRDFYHHMGGFFDAPPLRATFQVDWS
jgi:hypothetical protein